MRDFRGYAVYQQALEVVDRTYAFTAGFPRREVFGLASQMRRAAVSVASNIAEGAGRRTGDEFARFVRMALGSLNELDAQVEIAGRLGLAAESPGAVRRAIDENRRTAVGLLRRLEAPKASPRQ